MSSQVEDVKRLLTAAVNCKSYLDATLLVHQEAAEVSKRLDITFSEARGMVRARIGYFAGYLIHDEGQRMYELFTTEHPVYGRLSARDFDPVNDSWAIGEFMEGLGH